MPIFIIGGYKLNNIIYIDDMVDRRCRHITTGTMREFSKENAEKKGQIINL